MATKFYSSKKHSNHHYNITKFIYNILIHTKKNKLKDLTLIALELNIFVYTIENNMQTIWDFFDPLSKDISLQKNKKKLKQNIWLWVQIELLFYLEILFVSNMVVRIFINEIFDLQLGLYKKIPWQKLRLLCLQCEGSML